MALHGMHQQLYASQKILVAVGEVTKRLCQLWHKLLEQSAHNPASACR